MAVLNVIKDGMLAYLAIFTGFNAAKVFCNTRFRWCHWGTTLLTGITEDNPIKNVFTGEPLIVVKVAL